MLESPAGTQAAKPPIDALDRHLAAPMYLATIWFLVCLAGLAQLQEDEARFATLFTYSGWGMLAIYPAFVAELLLSLARRRRFWKQHLVYCLIPPLRLGCRDHITGEAIWFPGSGWVKVDRDLRPRMEKLFSTPMIVITLLTLPLMGADYHWSEKIDRSMVLATLKHGSFALIWLSFAFEFIIMLSIVDRKFRYIKEHWIDLVVILLPVVALLRFLRIARMGRLLRLQQLSKTGRVFRMRGSLMRMYRAILVLDVIDRLVRGKPEVRIRRLQQLLAEKELEIEAIRKEIRELQAIVAGSHPPFSKAA